MGDREKRREREEEDMGGKGKDEERMGGEREKRIKDGVRRKENGQNAGEKEEERAIKE